MRLGSFVSGRTALSPAIAAHGANFPKEGGQWPFIQSQCNKRDRPGVQRETEGKTVECSRAAMADFANSAWATAYSSTGCNGPSKSFIQPLTWARNRDD